MSLKKDQNVYIEENGVIVRDLGSMAASQDLPFWDKGIRQIPFSIQDNYMLNSYRPFGSKAGDGNRYQNLVYMTMDWLQAWTYKFNISPRNWKIHRSGHGPVLLAISVYLPYRYDSQINTALLALTKTKNVYLNIFLRFPAKILIYGASIITGQFIAR